MRSRMLAMVLMVGAMGLVACDSNEKDNAEVPPAKTDSSIASIPPAPEYSTPAVPVSPSPEVMFTDPASISPAAKPAKAGKVAAGKASSSIASAGNKYTVQKGDTLWKIAQKTYGNGKKYKDIVAANPGLDPNRIKVGQVLSLP